MKILIEWDNGDDDSVVTNLAQAEGVILDSMEYRLPRRVCEVDEQDNEGRDYGCNWSVKLEEIEP